MKFKFHKIKYNNFVLFFISFFFIIILYFILINTTTQYIKNIFEIIPFYNKFTVTVKSKTKFINSIIHYWKKTGGSVHRDTEGLYEYDYYLSLNPTPDYFNHIHLGLHNFHYTCDTHNNIVYIMKKLCKDNKTIKHSKVIHISIFSDPKKIVENMRINYRKFKNIYTISKI